MRKGTLFLLLILALMIPLAGQQGSPPDISINRKNATVKSIMKDISRQAGVDFSFNSNILDTKQRLSFSVDHANLEETLDIFCDALTLRYVIIDGQVVLNLAREAPPKENQLFTLSGFLADRESGENLIGTTVYVKGTTIGTYTNDFGFYSLSLKPGHHTIIYSHIGYNRQEANLEISSPMKVDFRLQPKSIELPEVVIKPVQFELSGKNHLGAMELPPEQLTSMPEFMGESGLVKGLQGLPGIKSQGDGSAYFYARGGERDQNLVIIDDAPIYNPSHLFGFYSMVIPDFTKSIQVYKSDMPSNIGDRLSSIISIRTKDGNLNKFELNGSVNPFVSRLSIETPLIKKRSAIFVTARQSNFDWIYKRNIPQLDINFRDFHFKWNLRLNDNNRIYLTTINSSDFSQFNNSDIGRTGIQRTNTAATLRWNHVYNPRLFSNTVIYSGNYTTRLFFARNYWKSELGSLGLKMDFTHYAHPGFQSKFGIEFLGYFNDPGSLTLDTTISLLPDIRPNSSRKAVLYYHADWNVRKNLSLHAGMRLISWTNLGPARWYTFDDNFQVNDTLTSGGGVYNRYTHSDPRVSLQYQINPSSQIRLGYGIYHQYLQMVSNSVSPFTSLEVWLPSSPVIRPQSARQWSLSFNQYLEDQQMEISAAAYHKRMWRQIDYEPHATTYLNPLLEGELRFGNTRAYGLELMIRKDFGKVNGWLAYTYSRAFRRTVEINNERTYPAIQDRPHDLSVFVNYQATRRIVCSVYWTSYSGSTFSSPTGYYTFNDRSVPVFGERNNDRLPAYHRLDFSATFTLNKRENSRYQHSLNFSMYNMLGHKNAYAIRFNRIAARAYPFPVEANVLSQENLVSSQLSLARFFPSLTYRFKL